jgi:hypothetical protein
MPHPS